MKVLLILGGILLILLALSLLRLGGQLRYDGKGLTLWLALGPLRHRVYPPRPKGRQKQQSGPQKPGGAERSKQKEAGGPPLPLRQMLPLIGEAAGRLRRKIRIDRLRLSVTAAGADPARAALAFGGANALIGMILPVLEHNFTVKDREIRTAVDFQGTESAVFLQARLTLRVGQAVVFALWLLSSLARQQEAGRKKSRSESQKEAV